MSNISFGPTDAKAVSAEHVETAQENLVSNLAIQDSIRDIQDLGPINIPPNQLLQLKKKALKRSRTKTTILRKKGEEELDDPDLIKSHIDKPGGQGTGTDSGGDSSGQGQQHSASDLGTTNIDEPGSTPSSSTLTPGQIISGGAVQFVAKQKPKDHKNIHKIKGAIKYYDSASTLIKQYKDEYKDVGTPEELSNLYENTVLSDAPPMTIFNTLMQTYKNKTQRDKAIVFLNTITAQHLKDAQIPPKELQNALHGIAKIRMCSSLVDNVAERIKPFEHKLNTPSKQAIQETTATIVDIISSPHVSPRSIKNKIKLLSKNDPEQQSIYLKVLQNTVSSMPHKFLQQSGIKSRNKKQLIIKSLRDISTQFDLLDTKAIQAELKELLGITPGQESVLFEPALKKNTVASSLSKLSQEAPGALKTAVANIQHTPGKDTSMSSMLDLFK